MKRRFSLFLTVALMLTLVTVPAFAKTSVRAGDNGKVEVTFTYAGNLDANAVYVAGEFNNWLPNFPTYKMKKENGVWTLTTQLEKGKYQYKFTVYGGGMLQWVADEDAASFAPDGYGGQNSVVIADPNAGLADRIVALEKQMAVTNIGFNYSGYARAGVLMNSNGGAQDTHIGLFPDFHSRWRLGNEPDTYVEQVFEKKFTGDNGSWMNAHMLLANKVTDYQSYNNDADEDAALREAYVEGGNFDFAPSLTFWAGERYYGRTDIHITDNRWRELDGFGGGVSGIDAGIGKLAVAYITRGTDDGVAPVADLGEKVQQNIDLRLTEIAVPGGNLEFELRRAWQNDADSANDRDGIELTAAYNRTDFFGFANGFTTIAVQHGNDIAADLGNPVGYTSKDAKGTALVAYGLGNFGKWDIMPQIVYENIDKQYGSNDVTNMMIGARVVRYITDNFSMQFEYGYEHQDNENYWIVDKDGDSADYTVNKFTVAPTVKLSNSFWGRPELRVFATYATVDGEATYQSWDGAYAGNPLGGAYGEKDDDAVTYGMQMEVWW
ncbi:hypothetical protein U472_13825 [Orenia metallireducens]|uniref:AMP-activated protein kinase glycogen-binding domain-containing protein n=1 Tax=Orenia metallireducens TaxID=1413210 RepID=A0A1C0A5K2_9FIRM|nr:carbohydrate porin [Orenia metallireducens]OCL25422.1 hypothetical protein U472_13825 [Orenia metallireducens]